MQLLPQSSAVSEDSCSTTAQGHVNGPSQSGQVHDGPGAEGVGVAEGVGQQQAALGICVVNLVSKG